jgi:hypothetical protein
MYPAYINVLYSSDIECNRDVAHSGQWNASDIYYRMDSTCISQLHASGSIQDVHLHDT